MGERKDRPRQRVGPRSRSALDQRRVDSLLKEGYEARRSEHEIMRRMHTIRDEDIKLRVR